MEQTAEEKRELMLTAPVEGLVCKMAVPTIITMLITAFYNMADTYFVGQLDTVSTAAVGLALPLMNIIQAIGFFFGHGSGNYISRKLGEGDFKAAGVMSDTAVIMSFVSGSILAAAGLAYLRPLVLMLGANELLEQSTRDYVSLLLIGVPFMMTSFTMNNQLRFRGSAFLGMIGMAIGSVLNVALDPLFIYVLGMQVKGAAIATVISQIIGFIVLLKMSGRLPLRKPEFHLSGEIVLSMFQFGTPSLFRQGIMSVAAVCLSHAAVVYGEAMVAAVSVVNKIVMLGASAVIGFGQGFQPVCGFNLGAGRYDRIKKMYTFCIKSSTVFMLFYGTAAFALAPLLIKIFRDDPDVISAGIPLLRFQCITAPFHGMIIMTNMLVQNMGKTVKASVLAMARQGLFFIPLIFILPHFFGIFGIQITQSSADFLTALITLPMMISCIKELSKKAA